MAAALYLYPPRTLQSFLRGIGDTERYSWHSGDFIAHGLGIPLEVRSIKLKEALRLAAVSNSDAK
jgi:hypothetical protein